MNSQIDIYHPKTLNDWRKWLFENSSVKHAVWVVFYKKGCNIPSISWIDAVDEALCFGWIDSKKIKIDDQKSHHYFSKRKANGTWSKINKDKIEKLMLENRMTSQGLESVQKAKKNGSWNLLDDVEALIIPTDLQIAFEKEPKAFEFYSALSKTNKKNILLWMVMAKLPETRIKRINTIIECALLNRKPPHM